MPRTSPSTLRRRSSGSSGSGLAALGVLLASLGCGRAEVGEQCNDSGYLCNGKGEALECRDGTWVLLPCRGAGGCVEVGDGISCDMSQNLEGDLCAFTAEGQVLCSASGRSTLECTEGELLQTHSCLSCTVIDGQIRCNQ